MLKDTGTFPENVNFAIKASELSSLLRGVNLAAPKKTTTRADAIARVQAASCQVISFLSDEPPAKTSGGSRADQKWAPRDEDPGKHGNEQKQDLGDDEENTSEPLSKEQVATGVATLKDKLMACKDAETIPISPRLR